MPHFAKTFSLFVKHSARSEPHRDYALHQKGETRQSDSDRRKYSILQIIYRWRRALDDPLIRHERPFRLLKDADLTKGLKDYSTDSYTYSPIL